MKKILLTLVLSMAVATALNMVLFRQTPQIIASTKLGSIVRLVRDGRTQCSGVVVNNRTILTAAHCVMMETPFGVTLDTEPLEIRVDDNIPRNVFATPYAVREQLDQAFLKGDFHAFHTRTVVSDPVVLEKIGHNSTTFISCGYPMHGGLYCREVYFEDVYDLFWAVNGLIYPGMSGGPVLLEDGRVIAINDAVEKNFSLVSPTVNVNLDFQPED